MQLICYYAGKELCNHSKNGGFNSVAAFDAVHLSRNIENMLWTSLFLFFLFGFTNTLI